jgi:heptosyltransferase-2
MTTPRKILFLQTAFFGDVIMSTPIPRALKQLYPEAEIDIVLIPATRIVYEGNTHINRIYTFDKKNPLRRLPSLIGLIRQLRREKYDLALTTHISLSTSLILLLSGAKIRLGYPRLRFKNLTSDIPKSVPVVKRGLLLLKALSDRDFDHQTEVFIPVGTTAAIQGFLVDHSVDTNKLVTIAPGSVWATKRWLPEYFSNVLADLARHGYTCVLVGSTADRELCEDVIRTSGTQALNTAGEINLLGSAELIRQSRLLISNDSAPLHLANAVKTPVLGIFGPTVKRFGCFPYREGDRVMEIDLDCRPCGKHGHQKCPRGHFRCMREISPGSVASTALKMLGVQA